MKNIYALAFFFFTIILNAQISLEHTYNTSSGYIGERYSFAFYTDAGLNHFTYEESTKTIRTYNENHSLIKTFVVPMPVGYTFYTDGIASGGPIVSDKLFNGDAATEMLIPLYATGGSTGTQYKFILINDSGNLIQEFDNVNKCGGIYKTSTNVFKLILMHNQNPSSEVYVYALPGVLSLSQQQSITAFRVYPNPTENIFTLKGNFKNITGDVMKIYDTAGKIVLSQRITKVSDEIDVDISRLNSGIYMYKLGENTGKIVKN